MLALNLGKGEGTAQGPLPRRPLRRHRNRLRRPDPVARQGTTAGRRRPGSCSRRLGEREREARRGAALFLKGATRTNVIIKQFRDGSFPLRGRGHQGGVRIAEARSTPDLVLTHYRDDRHQDHRVLSDLAWNTFRDHLVLEYEIPKFDGDLGSPNCFVPLDRATCAAEGEATCRRRSAPSATSTGSRTRPSWG